MAKGEERLHKETGRGNEAEYKNGEKEDGRRVNVEAPLDLYAKASRVHSEAVIDDISEDWTLADLDPKVLQNPILRYAVKQLEALEMIKEFLEDEETMDICDVDEKGRITTVTVKVCDLYTVKFEKLIRKKIDGLFIGSRSHKGAVLHSMLKAGMPAGQTNPEEGPKEVEPRKSLGSSLFKKKEKEGK